MFYAGCGDRTCSDVGFTAHPERKIRRGVGTLGSSVETLILGTARERAFDILFEVRGCSVYYASIQHSRCGQLQYQIPPASNVQSMAAT